MQIYRMQRSIQLTYFCFILKKPATAGLVGEIMIIPVLVFLMLIATQPDNVFCNSPFFIAAAASPLVCTRNAADEVEAHIPYIYS